MRHFILAVFLSAMALANGASPGNPYLLPPFKESAIVVAAANGELETVKLLLQQGVSPNEQECDDLIAKDHQPCKIAGWTSLMMSSAHGHIEVVRVLLVAGADPEICDYGGHSAFWYAEERGSSDIINLLRSARGK